MNYHIVDERFVPKPNTAEYGFGDYAKSERYVRLTVTAETEKEAKKLARREDKGIRFSGFSGCSLYEDRDLPMSLRKQLSAA